jgi:uncharacterized protein YegL
MKAGLTDVTVILDRSGSMESVAKETIGAFNRLLVEQKAQPGDVLFSLVQFDDVYEEIQAGVPIAQATPLDRSTFVPRGLTALLDALGLTIDRVGARLAALTEAERPSSVIVALMTDGDDNVSCKFGKPQVTRMVREQETRYGWTFMFLGAGIDAIGSAADLGIGAGMAFAYPASGRGVANAYTSLSNNLSRVRRGDRSGFTVEERNKMQN